MRGAPQRGCAAASFPIRAVTSIAMRGRPPGGRHERWIQDARRRRRGQRRTVSGGHDHGRPPPAGSGSGQAGPEETVHDAQPRPGSCSLVDGELPLACRTGFWRRTGGRPPSCGRGRGRGSFGRLRDHDWPGAPSSEVGEEHRDLPTLALQGSPGRQNLLGELPRGVGLRGPNVRRGARGTDEYCALEAVTSPPPEAASHSSHTRATAASRIRRRTPPEAGSPAHTGGTASGPLRERPGQGAMRSAGTAINHGAEVSRICRTVPSSARTLIGLP